MGPGLFRLILAMFVVIEHAWAPLELGGAAVMLFFVLSGYWITSVIQRRYSVIDGGHAIFLLARLWRLYPAFLIAVFVSAYFHPEGLAGLSLANLSLMSQEGHAKYMQVAWTLVVEVQFYIIAPLLALVIRNDKARFYVLCLSGAAMIYFYNTSLFGRSLPFFVCGAVAATVQWRPSGKLVLACLALAVGFFAIAEAASGIFMRQIGEPFDATNMWIANQTLAALLAPLAIWTATNRSGPVDKFLGDISYSLYLAHWPIVTNVGAVLFWLPGFEMFTKKILFSLVAGLALYAAELPFEKARRIFLHWIERPSHSPATRSLAA